MVAAIYANQAACEPSVLIRWVDALGITRPRLLPTLRCRLSAAAGMPPLLREGDVFRLDGSGRWSKLLSLSRWRKDVETMRPLISKAFARALLCAHLTVFPFIGQEAEAAEKKVVLQINDDGPEREASALNVAQALVNRFGEDLFGHPHGPGQRLGARHETWNQEERNAAEQR